FASEAIMVLECAAVNQHRFAVLTGQSQDGEVHSTKPLPPVILIRMLGIGRTVVMSFALTTVMYGDDITVPLEGGKIVIHNARFIRPDAEGQYIPELSFKIDNHTSAPWWALELQFHITGRCNGESRRWSFPATTSLGWSEDHIVGNAYRETE